MVTLIRSTSYERRKAIRESWGSVRYVSTRMFFYVFVIPHYGENISASLQNESERSHDLLVFEGSDDYT